MYGWIKNYAEDGGKNMDILYRLFYTVFSMSCMIIVLTPVVLLLRFLFRKQPRSFTVALWAIFYFRAVCPVGMSSPVCLSAKGNRWFHILLRSIGLTMTPDRGLMTSWRQVFHSRLEVTIPYTVCVVLWVVGIAGILLFTWRKQCALKKSLGDAGFLFDNVYQSPKLQKPVRIGVFRQRIYLPEGLLAKEMKGILFHQQMHCSRKDDWLGGLFFLISCIHWWNPCIWLAYYLSWLDREISCDEAVVKKGGLSGRADYAQDILNMEKEKKDGALSGSLVTFQEGRLPFRAEHMLYMEPSPVWKRASVAFLLTVCVFCWFAMSALHTAWNGGEWRVAEDVQEQALFPEDRERGVTNEVIASCESQTPEGTAVRLELLMTQGTFMKGRGYTGQSILRMQDENDITLASLTLSQIFVGEKVQQFDEAINLSVDDYNEDGVMEVSIGQKMQVETSRLAVPASGGAVATGAAVDEGTPQPGSRRKSGKSGASSGPARKTGENKNGEKTTVYGYYLINLETDCLRVISEPVYMSDANALQTGSTVFSFIEDTEGVITTQLEGETAYYVWEKEDKMYYRRSMTQDEINARIKRPEDGIVVGETKVYSLEDDENREVVRVAARMDETGRQSVENVSINPRGVDKLKGLKTFTDIHGYYKKLEWAPEADGGQQYAIVTYDGDSGQTFVVYDVGKKRVFYRQKEGNGVLKELFESFHETEITLKDGGMAVYSLMEIADKGVLKIGFAATEEGDATVRGNYLYHTATGQTSDLQYTREKN